MYWYLNHRHCHIIFVSFGTHKKYNRSVKFHSYLFTIPHHYDTVVCFIPNLQIGIGHSGRTQTTKPPKKPSFCAVVAPKGSLLYSH